VVERVEEIYFRILSPGWVGLALKSVAVNVVYEQEGDMHACPLMWF
jgi:hypothetical protein